MLAEIGTVIVIILGGVYFANRWNHGPGGSVGVFLATVGTIIALFVVSFGYYLGYSGNTVEEQCQVFAMSKEDKQVVFTVPCSSLKKQK